MELDAFDGEFAMAEAHNDAVGDGDLREYFGGARVEVKNDFSRHTPSYRR